MTKKPKFMREIKFRAWHKTQKRMINDVLAIKFKNGTVENIFQDDLIMLEGEDIEIMQYTGLKDKNGKEIYEGDIVKCPNEQVYSIDWNDTWGAWMFCGLESLVTILPDGSAIPEYKFCEVIGNIYENSELISKLNQDDKH